MMLSVSQQFNLVDLLTNILSKFNASEPGNQGVGDLSRKLKEKLCGKRYLLILDDVWDAQFWAQLEHALPDDKNGSRILMTSRSMDVAIKTHSKIPPYQLPFLQENESRELLLKKALPDRECPRDLDELANDFSKKCKGLPLGLVVLGSLLAENDPTYENWKKIYDTLDWQEEGKECMQILALSYEDMPYYLKPCFLYLAGFPEDYEIHAKYLIRMWVAEGFIPRQGKKTIEQVAEDFLEQLFKRYFSPSAFLSCTSHTCKQQY